MQGTVVLDDVGKPDYVAGAKIIIQSDFTIESAVTDQHGKFHFPNLDPGTYTVEATYFGLYAEQTITVEPGIEVQVPLQLRPLNVGSSARR